MFNGNWAEQDKKEIVINDINGAVLEKLIDYCYTGEISINKDNILNLVPAISKLQFDDLKDECAEFLKLILFQNPNDCLSVYSIADLYSFDELAKHSISVVIDFFPMIIKTNDFLNITFEMLKLMLEQKEHVALTEDEIFHATMKWIKNDEATRNKHTLDILDKLSLNDMSVAVSVFFFENMILSNSTLNAFFFFLIVFI